MTKTQKQRDKHIRQALTVACEKIKKTVFGFMYLTHTVDLNNEANTLKVTCYFKDDTAYHHAESQFNTLIQIITEQLFSIGLVIKPKYILFLTD
jgi:hypothetical protein